MQGLAGAAIAIFVVASTVVALRMLALHRRTHALPELLLGGMLLLSVGVGYPAMIIADRAGPQWSATFFAVAVLGLNAGFSLLFLFTWQVFRRNSIPGGALAGVGVLALLATTVQQWISLHQRGAFHIADQPFSESMVQIVLVMIAYLWAVFESLRYYALMRRRLKLGLADPAITNRFLLWGLMGLDAAVGVMLNAVAGFLHVEILTNPWILLCSSCTGLGQTLFLLLTFVPPRSYLEWVRARAAKSGA